MERRIKFIKEYTRFIGEKLNYNISDKEMKEINNLSKEEKL